MLVYNQVSFEDLRDRFSIRVEAGSFLPAIEPLPLPDWLRQYLAINQLIPVIAKSEKAVSEVIIAPILSAVKAQQQSRIAIFSGEPLSGLGLTGICDFIITTNPTGFIAEPPIMVLIAAKRQNLLGGIPQCVAKMLAARYVNEQAGLNYPATYGCVTTGTEWQFLRLVDDLAITDSEVLYFDNLGKVISTLSWIVQQLR